MPFARRARSTRPRRRRLPLVRSRRRYQNFRRHIPTNLKAGCAQNQVVKFKFGFDSGDDHAIASTTGSFVDYAYRATSPYDPYAETGGAQPRGFDQWMALYNKGVVLGSKITATFYFSPGSTTNNAMSVGIARKMSIADVDAPLLSEARNGVRKVITANNDKVVCVLKYSYRELCKDPNDAENLEFASDGNSTTQVYFHVGGFAMNSQTQTCRFVGNIQYTVLLKEPINPGQS